MTNTTVQKKQVKTSAAQQVIVPGEVLTTTDPTSPVINIDKSPETASHPGPAKPKMKPVSPKQPKSQSTESQSTINTKTITHDDLGIGDPFNYSVSGLGEFSPSSAGKPVGMISIKGIIRIKGQEPLAILHLKNSNRSYYVKRGNVIRINTQAKTGNLVKEAYIVVKEVRDDEVELVQQERPDKVIIIR